MNTLLDEFRRQIRARGLSVWDQQTERGLLRFLTLREGRRTGEAMVNIVASAPDVAALMPVAEALRARMPATASVVLNVNAKKASVAVGSEEHLLLGRDHITESLGGVHFAGLGQLVLPDEHGAGRAAVRAGGRGAASSTAARR